MLRLRRSVMNARHQRPLLLALLAALLTSSTPGWVTARQSSSAGAKSKSSTPVSTASLFDENASTDELMESAREMFIADKYDLAEMLYKGVLVREPNNLAAMLELAIIYEASGQLQYARGLLTRALVIRPHDLEIIKHNTEVVHKLSIQLETEIDSLVHAGAHEQAIPKLAILLTMQPENADLSYKKADCHLQLGEYEVALIEIDQALRLAREDRYYDLKAQTLAAMNGDEINELLIRAKRALRSGAAETNEVALQLISRILELDPGNTWAREQFMALTEADTRLLSLDRWNLSERLATLWEPTKRQLDQIGRWLVLASNTLSGHLDILLTVLFALLIFGSPLTHMLIRGFSPRQSLSGRLDHFSLPELLALVNTHQRTGVLVLRTSDGKGEIYFERGEIYHCKGRGASTRDALQKLLRTATQGFFVFKDGVVSKEDTIDTPLSLILLELPERVDAITSESILKKQKQQSRMKSLLKRDD